MGAGPLFSQLINLAVLAELTLREVADCLLDPVCKTKQNKTKQNKTLWFPIFPILP